MLLFPTTDLRETRSRAERILQHGLECSDAQLLAELWCAVRNTEFAQPQGAHRTCLRQIREEVAEAIALVQAKA